AQFEPGILHLISLHEAFPGHFVHFLHLRRAPGRAARLLRSYATLEGWAHYCEEMMLEAGYTLPTEAEPAHLEFSQALAALERCCRYLAALGMHCDGLTLEQASELFRRRAFMDPVRARSSAARATFDPEYGCYTLGKLMIRKLRRDSGMEMRSFHNALLGLGAPPLALARRYLGVPGPVL
ncbi:MAG: DUF885 family protein, partial [Candidatus Eremiobacterota bacterium]